MKQLCLFLGLVFLSGCNSSIESQLEGRWTGAAKPGDEIAITFKKNNRVAIEVDNDIGEGTYSISGSSNPYHLVLDIKDIGRIHTIIAINGDSLTIENSEPGEPPPSTFSDAAMTLKKQKT